VQHVLETNLVEYVDAILAHATHTNITLLKQISCNNVIIHEE